jgi:dihydrofolate reductase
MPGMRVFVFSRTLRQADCPDATVSDDPGTVVRGLKAEDGKDIWLFGGGQLFRSLLDLGLVDAVQVGIVPVILGDGLPMVEHPAGRAKLRLTKHRVYAQTGTVLLDYDVV